MGCIYNVATKHLTYDLLMKIYFGSIRTWYGYFARFHDRRSPIPDSIPQLGRCFPSFWYFRNSPDGLLDTMPGKDVIIDSGAHTVFAQTGYSAHSTIQTKGETNRQALIKLFQEYLVFVKRNWEAIDYFVELDVASLFGMEIVRSMREDIKRSGMWSKCMLAWHRENGADDYEWILDNTEAKWIGMEGQRPGAKMLPYNRYLKPAYERGIRVHGFALIVNKILKKFPFYSVDAISWLTPVLYGGQPTFQGNKIAFLSAHRNNSHKTPSQLWKPQKRLEKSIEAYKQMEKFYTDYWVAKGVDWERQIQNV